MPPRLVNALIAAVTLPILVATLYPSEVPAWVVGPKVRVNVGGADLVRNLALFGPLGVALALRGMRAARVVLILALFSLAIELAQLGILSRTTSPWDVLGNTLGGSVGFAIAATWRRWTAPPPAVARGLCVAAGIAAALVFWGTSKAVQPRVPWDPLFSHQPAGNPHFDRFSGSELAAWIDGHIVRRNRVRDVRRVHAALSGDYELLVSAVLGPRSDRPMNFFMMSASKSRRILSLVPHGDDLIFLYRIRAKQVGLENATFRVRGALRDVVVGERVDVRVTRVGAETCIEVRDRRHCGIGFGPGDGWALILPLFVTDRVPAALLGWSWMAALFLPIGFWMRPGWSGWGALALAAGAAVASPITGPLLPLSIGHAAAGAAGFGVGRGLGRVLNPPEPRSDQPTRGRREA